MFSSQLPNKYIFSSNPSRAENVANRSCNTSFDSAHFSEYIPNSQREFHSNPSSQDLFPNINPHPSPKRYSASQDAVFSKPKQVNIVPSVTVIRPEKIIPNDANIELLNVLSTLMKDILAKLTLLTSTLDNALVKMSVDLKTTLCDSVDKLQNGVGNYYKTLIDDAKESEKEKSDKSTLEVLLKERNETIEELKAHIRNMERESRFRVKTSLSKVIKELQQSLRKDTAKLIKQNKELVTETRNKLDVHLKAEEALLGRALQKLKLSEKSGFCQGNRADENRVRRVEPDDGPVKCLRSGVIKIADDQKPKRGRGRPRKVPKVNLKVKSDSAKDNSHYLLAVSAEKVKPKDVPRSLGKSLQLVPNDDGLSDEDEFLFCDDNLPQINFEFFPRRGNNKKDGNEFFI